MVSWLCLGVVSMTVVHLCLFPPPPPPPPLHLSSIPFPLSALLLFSFPSLRYTSSSLRRRAVLLKVCELAKQWVVDVSRKKGKPEEEACVLGCKVFTFGSYRLGVHGQGEREGPCGWGGEGSCGGWEESDG